MIRRQKDYVVEVLQRELAELKSDPNEFALREEQDALEQAIGLIGNVPEED